MSWAEWGWSKPFLTRDSTQKLRRDTVTFCNLLVGVTGSLCCVVLCCVVLCCVVLCCVVLCCVVLVLLCCCIVVLLYCMLRRVVLCFVFVVLFVM